MPNLSTVEGFDRILPFWEDPLLHTVYEKYEACNFETEMLTAMGGSAGVTVGTSETERPNWMYSPSTIADSLNHQNLIMTRNNLSVGVVRTSIDWGKRKIMSVRFYYIGVLGIIRCYWGPTGASSGNPLTIRGMGFEIQDGSIFATCHNGTIKTTSAIGIAINTSMHNIVMDSDGLGNVRWWLDGVEQIAITGGPMGNSSINAYSIGTSVKAPNPGGSITMNIQRITLYSKN